MRELRIAELTPGFTFAVPIFHKSGNLLFREGENLTHTHLQALRAANVESVYECPTEHDLSDLLAGVVKRPVPLLSFSPDQPIEQNIFDRHNRFLLKKTGVIKRPLFESLFEKGMDTVYIDTEEDQKQLRDFSFTLIQENARKLDERFADPALLGIEHGRSAVEDLVKKRPATRSAREIEAAAAVRTGILQETRECLGILRVNDAPVDGETLRRMSAGLRESLFKDLDLALNSTRLKGEMSQWWVDHSVNVATLCLAMGADIGLTEEHLHHLGRAALLHEIGMMRIVPIALREGPLDALGWTEIKRHPIYALDYLERVTGLTDPERLSVYQEHERFDGSGYPRERTGRQVHAFAKILALADIYEAATSPRSYRAALLPYRAVEEIVRLGSKRVLDPVFVRSFLRVMGLFPVGSWVRLSTREVGRVTGIHPEPFDRPVVRVLYDAGGQPLDAPRLVGLQEQKDIRVVEAVDPEGLPADPALGF
ncbi:MAG: HD domain-containing phosphohydrolase [Planctomycetota bacterium]